MDDRPAPHPDAVELVLHAHPRDLGGFEVRRVLPAPQRRLVGPFVFFDHLGPAVLPPGGGFDVRPHPHVGLATVTFLFDGEILHRDSLGYVQAIRPGALNWMTAGRGIVHSERLTSETRARGQRLHGIQSWVALPLADEDLPPSFVHHPADELPRVERPGVVLDVIAGSAYGARSPAPVRWPTLYVHARLAAGARLDVDDGHAERAVYVVEGTVRCAGASSQPGTLLVLRAGEAVALEAVTDARVMLLGGATMDGERHVWWNFVASTPERLDAARARWRDGEFPTIPGDDREFIPLPEP